MIANPGINQDARKNVLGIAACMLLVMVAFSPWMSFRVGKGFTLGSGGSSLTLSGSANNFGLAATAGIALALLFARHRWALIIPSLYGAVAFLRLMLGWVISLSPVPQPAQFPGFLPNLGLGVAYPAPELVLLVSVRHWESPPVGRISVPC
jgi:hypothetical protein